MWRPLVVTCTESCYVPIREKNSRFPALSEQWSHGCHGKDTKPEHFVSQRRNIHVNLFFFFFLIYYVFTMKVRSRKTMTKKWTFLFDSVMFSKSSTRVVIGVVVRVRIRFFCLT